MILQGHPRYQIIRKLGAGGMGLVFEAIDRQTDSRVAVKTLPYAGGDALLKFKREFRNFQALAHPHFVSLGELFEWNGGWFFTMDLIEGTDFLSAVRARLVPGRHADSNDATEIFEERSLAANVTSAANASSVANVTGTYPGTVDLELLRTATGQLVVALMALHESGRIHRDIKSSNVLVTPEGHVVILDFGLGLMLGNEKASGAIVGTPMSMAPEQASGGAVGPPADWYALGVLLYQAVTGYDPFGGSLYKILLDKQSVVPPAPCTLIADLPSVWSDLCVELLAIDPGARPKGREILQRLGLRDHRSSLRPPPRGETYAFVGRERELEALSSAWAHARARRSSHVVWVFGDSGLGKSALVARFADDMAQRDRALVLSGRCHEHESVPYKAIDGIVDALSRYLAALPPEHLVGLLPERAALLAATFPVLAQLDSLGSSAALQPPQDPVELRSEVFAVVRELFARMARAQPTLITVDDLQWADGDSLLLLHELWRGDDAPPILWALTSRGTPPSNLQEQPRSTCIRLDPLSQEDSIALANQVLGDRAVDLETMLQHAAGHPLFIEVLAQHVLQEPLASDGLRSPRLDDALQTRLERLGKERRAVLECTCLGNSLEVRTVSAATSIDPSEVRAAVKWLKNARLLRTDEANPQASEPYHARVRDAVIRKLPPEARAACHRRLASSLESEGARPETLALHWREAGDVSRASRYAVDAARAANEALAFEQAARFYRMALDATSWNGKERSDIYMALAAALVNAGQGERGARAYVHALEGAPPASLLRIRRLAAEQFLRSGHVDEGLLQLSNVLDAVGLRLPRSNTTAALRILWGQGRLRLRGLQFRESPPIPASERARLDACWAATSSLFIIDHLRSMAFQTRYVRMALDSGDPHHVAQALGIHAISAAAAPHTSRPEQDLMKAYLVAACATDAVPVMATVAPSVAYLRGRWKQALETGEAAERRLRNEYTGAAWEVSAVRQLVLWALCFLGDYRALESRIERDLAEATERGDLFSLVGMASGYPNFRWILRDLPQRARAESMAAVQRWSRRGFYLQHLFHLIAQTHIDLYEGRAIAAVNRVEAAQKGLASSRLLVVEINRILSLDLHARACLHAVHADPPKRGVHLKRAEGRVASLERESATWGKALGTALRGALEFAEGRSSHSLACLKKAADAFEAEGMQLHTACAAGAIAALEPAGRSTYGARARAYFATQGVVQPARVAAIWLPGLPFAFDAC